MASKTNMEKTIEALQKSGEEMGKEIKDLRASIGSYKAANTRMKETLEKCKAEAQDEVLRLHGDINRLKRDYQSLSDVHQKLGDQCKKLKAYAHKADEMNENKANRIVELEKQLETAIIDVEVAHDANSTTNEQIATISQANKDLSDEICALKANIEWYNALPWYRKIFVTKI